MSNALYDLGREKFLKGEIDWADDDIKCVLVDLDDYALQVSAATNASPIQITTSASHGLTTGDRVLITGVGGNDAANGVFTVTVVDATNFTLDDSTGDGTYTSGGHVVLLSLDEHLDDIPSGARVATSGNLGTKTTTLGVADAADVTFSTVTGDQSEALVIYKDSGSASTSPLIAILTTATGLPVTPSGGDITVEWDSGANKIFKL